MLTEEDRQLPGLVLLDKRDDIVCYLIDLFICEALLHVCTRSDLGLLNVVRPTYDQQSAFSEIKLPLSLGLLLWHSRHGRSNTEQSSARQRTAENSKENTALLANRVSV